MDRTSDALKIPPIGKGSVKTTKIMLDLDKVRWVNTGKFNNIGVSTDIYFQSHIVNNLVSILKIILIIDIDIIIYFWSDVNNDNSLFIYF